MIVSASGHNMIPIMFEQALEQRLSHLVDHVVLVGEGRPYLVALIELSSTPDPTTGRSILLSPSASAFISTRCDGVRTETVADAKALPSLHKVIEEALDAVNRSVPRTPHEVVSKFAIVSEGFTLTGGELTSTAKLKRRAIIEKYGSTISSLYA